jgi:hypothetical protein
MRTEGLAANAGKLMSPLTEACSPAALSRMMGDMVSMARRGSTRLLQLALFVFIVVVNAIPALAQVEYSVHFEMEKPKYLLGARFLLSGIARPPALWLSITTRSHASG